MDNTTTVTTDGLTDDQALAIQSLRVTLGFLSLFCSLFIFISIGRFRDIRRNSIYRLLFATFVSTFLQGLADVLVINDLNPSEGRCIFQAWLLQLSQVCVICLVTALSCFLFFKIVYTTESEKYYHERISYGLMVVWVIIASFVPFHEGYGKAGPWCWIKASTQAYRWTLFYVPLFIQLFIVLVFTVLTSLSILRHSKEITEENKELIRITRRSPVLPIVFILLYFFPIVSRIYEGVNGKPLFGLALVGSITAPAVGISFSLLLWWVDKDLIRSWWHRVVVLTPSPTTDPKPTPGAVEDNTDIVEESGSLTPSLSDEGEPSTSSQQGTALD